MAGITDLPFRRLVSRFGAGLVVSEMVASQEMMQAKPGVRDRAALDMLAQQGTAVQLAGRDPYWMAEAARMVAANGAKIIDINMGCPAKKVTGGLSGSALMKDPDLAVRLIDAVIAAVDVPVTVKMRLGWNEDALNAPDLARCAEGAGAQMITVHGRTRCQFYKGAADWSAVKHTVEAVDIPVIVNGDITDAETARMAQAASGAAGVMVGRGAQGRPWVLADIAADLQGEDAPVRPRGQVLADLVIAHHEDMLSFYGVRLGVRVARKHLGWYMQAEAVAPCLRKSILTSETPGEIHHLLTDAFVPVAAIAA